MQLPLLTLLAGGAGLAAAWSLDVYGTDGRHANFHGTRDTGCNAISFQPVINVNKASFNPATDFYPDPDTFELYLDTGCTQLSYRSGKGSHTLTPARKIKAYKVH